MKYLLLFTTLIFAAEMEVDGDLKVTGTVDANGNPITNVGAALSMTDAINGNVLQSALRDDGVYEHMFILGRIMYFSTNSDDQPRWSQYMILSEDQPGNSYWINGLSSILNQYSLDGWSIQFLDSQSEPSYKQHVQVLYQLRRPISDD